jgi:hypothetical protein
MDSGKPHFYRKPEGGYVRPIFKIEKLRDIAKTFPGDQEDLGGRAYYLGLVILKLCFGLEWLEKHVLSEPKDGFLGRSLGSEYGNALVMHRVRDLAEMVLNLLPVRGIEAPLDQLVGGEIESAVAELGVGKLLQRRALQFRFIWPSGIRGQSFDNLITFPNGIEVCADTKCKFEERAFSPTGVKNTLDEARKRNLPKGYPCAIFMKIPHPWVRDQETFSAMEAAIWRFLGGAPRIVTVQVYASIVDMIGNVVHDSEWGWEYVNKTPEFHPDLDWKALNRGTLPDANGWVRLVDIVRSATR